MKSYKDPSFQDRVGRAAEAKQKALDKLRSKPPVDEKVLAERQAARLKREAAEAEKRAAKKAAEQAAKEAQAEAEARAAAEAAAQAAAVPAPPTEAERKAARDARYAARKNRK
jgi:septal ring factor EnvC (AmiA/AmiB activator)